MASGPAVPESPPQGYRPALDGLRAVAVLSVFAYHLQLPALRGGFLGVDLFFVLSGYLITGLLLAEQAATGGISLSRFWARRARRLLPALLLVVVAVAVAVRLLRPVTEWPARRDDLIWTLFYGANWRQILTSQDYFSAWRSASPLRHMWSIAIEEQFYVIWPLISLVLLQARARRWFLPVVIGAALVSAVAAAALFDPANPTRAYVGTDARAQELLIGAALAFVLHHYRASTTRLATAATVGGLAAAGLVGALIAFPDTAPLYYRGGALAISLTASALLWSVEVGPRTMLARALSMAPVAWLGRISYGLYLWHWPVILFTPTVLVKLFGGRGLVVAENRPTLVAVTVIITLACTLISYYLVEQPIRHGVLARRLPPLRAAMAGVAAAVATFFVITSTLAVPPALLAQVSQTGTECEAKMDSTKIEIPTCLVVNGGPNRPVLALMGDSVARSLNPAFARLAQAHGWSFVAAAHNHCTLILRNMGGVGWESCYKHIPIIEQQVLASKPTLIVASDNWLPMESHDAAGVLRTRNSPEHIADIERRLGPLVAQLTSTGAQLVLMRYTPESAAIECADEPLAHQPRCQVPAVHPRFLQYNAMIDRVAARYSARVRVIDLTDVVCPGGQCTAKVGGIIMRYDTLHFSDEGARRVTPHLERKLIEAGIRLDL